MKLLSILIADDDEIILEMLKLAFEKCGLKVFTAKNGSDAWSLFCKEHTDIVITDMWMPGLNGNELSRLIRNQSPLTKIALMTGAEVGGLEDLLNDGTANYLFMKPFNIGRICKILKADALVYDQPA